MKILEIRNINRDEGFIYYRRIYSGTAVIELPIRNVESSINFTIEMLPTGKKNIDLDILDNVEYPLIPLKKAITEKILNMDYEGELPC